MNASQSVIAMILEGTYHKIQVPARQKILIVSRDGEEVTRIAFTAVCHQERNLGR